MVLTAAQTTAFFENNDQMGIPHETMVQLQHEGIQSVADLADSFQQLVENLRKPGGRIPDHNPNAAEGATIPTPTFIYGAMSQKTLAAACNLIRYYQTVGINAASTNDATCFFMDDLGFLGVSFLAFLDPALKVLGLLALHSFSSSFCSLLRFLYSPVL